MGQWRFGRSSGHSDFLRELIEGGSDVWLVRVGKPGRHTRLVFRIEYSPSTPDDVLARAAIAKLTVLTTCHGIDYLCQSENESERDVCTFTISRKANRERHTAVDLDDSVALIDPSSKDLLKWRNFRASRLTTLYMITNKYVPSFLLEQTASRLTCPLEFNPALKQAPLLATRMVCTRPVAAEAKLTPGGELRSLERIFSGLPYGADGLQTERGGRSAAPEVGNAVDIDSDCVRAAARRVDRGYFRGAERAQEVGRY